MANTNTIWQRAAHTTYQLSSPSCSTGVISRVLTGKSQKNGLSAQKRPDKKSKKATQKNRPPALQ